MPWKEWKKYIYLCVTLNTGHDARAVLNEWGTNDDIYIFYKLITKLTYACPVRSEEETEWKCKECSQVFQNLPDLNDHKKTHNKVDRPFMCEMCPNTYPTAYKLKVWLSIDLEICNID